MTQHTVYLEVINEWTAETTYHAETIPASVSLEDWTQQTWTDAGYRQRVHKAVVNREIR